MSCCLAPDCFLAPLPILLVVRVHDVAVWPRLGRGRGGGGGILGSDLARELQLPQVRVESIARARIAAIDDGIPALDTRQVARDAKEEPLLEALFLQLRVGILPDLRACMNARAQTCMPGSACRRVQCCSGQRAH